MYNLKRYKNFCSFELSEDNTSLILTSISLILVSFFIYLSSGVKIDKEKESRIINQIKNGFIYPINSRNLKETSVKKNSFLKKFKESGFFIKEVKNQFIISSPYNNFFTKNYRIRTKAIKVIKELKKYFNHDDFHIKIFTFSKNTPLKGESLKKLFSLKRLFKDLKINLNKENLSLLASLKNNPDSELILIIEEKRK